MYETYKPSGKISWVFFPILFLVLLLVAPAVSFIYTALTWYVPSFLFSFILYPLCAVFLAFFGSILCIKIGKVRNTGAAFWCGAITALVFCYLSLVFYCTFRLGNTDTVSLFSRDFTIVRLSAVNLRTTLLHPKNVLTVLQELTESYYYKISFFEGIIAFTVEGALLIVVWGIQLLLTLLCFAVYFDHTGRKPFCESSKKWAKKIALKLEYIEDPGTLLKTLICGDAAALRKLNAVRTVNDSYAEIQLYTAEEDSNFYISIENKKRTGGYFEQNGKTEFDSEEIAALLVIDRQSGEALLTLSDNT